MRDLSISLRSSSHVTCCRIATLEPDRTGSQMSLATLQNDDVYQHFLDATTSFFTCPRNRGMPTLIRFGFDPARSILLSCSCSADPPPSAMLLIVEARPAAIAFLSYSVTLRKKNLARGDTLSILFQKLCMQIGFYPRATPACLRRCASRQPLQV